MFTTLKHRTAIAISAGVVTAGVALAVTVAALAGTKPAPNNPGYQVTAVTAAAEPAPPAPTRS